MEAITSQSLVSGSPDELSRILTVVVLYQQRLESSSTLISLNAALEVIGEHITVLVYDNSPHVNSIQSRDTTFSNLDIVYVADEFNHGLSRAYNVAIQLAHASGKRWLLVLDQDSYLSSDFVRQTAASISANSMIDLHLPIVFSLGRIVSPVKLLAGRTIGHTALKAGVNPPSEFFAVNSGMLINIDYLEQIGGYDERFRVYLTDNWFCDKYSRQKKPFVLTGAKIDHRLSRDESVDKDHLLELYRLGLQGYRMIYADRALHRWVLFSFASFGALKRALLRRDFRYIKVLAAQVRS